jgi:hypothetical protein
MALSTHEFQWIHSHPKAMISLQKDFFRSPKLQVSVEGHQCEKQGKDMKNTIAANQNSSIIKYGMLVK